MNHGSRLDVATRRSLTRLLRNSGLAIAATIGIASLALNSCEGGSHPGAQAQPLIWDSGQWDNSNWS
jgi:hypothetical protein